MQQQQGLGHANEGQQALYSPQDHPSPSSLQSNPIISSPESPHSPFPSLLPSVNPVAMQSSPVQPYAFPQPSHPILSSELDLQIAGKPVFARSMGTNTTNSSSTNSNSMNGNDGENDEDKDEDEEQGHSMYFRKDPSMDYQVDLHDDIINKHSIRQQRMGLDGIDNDNRYIPNPDYVGD